MDPRRRLPSVERVLRALRHDDLPHGLRVKAAREAVEHARERLAAGDVTSFEAVVEEATARLATTRTGLLGRVVNATGVLLHTNLGRAPLGRDTVDAIAGAARYSNLEYRLDTGRRGARGDHAGHLLASACGAEAGLVVNNNAAAVLLVLAALARDHEVVVSRGELVEIGGGFRVPEVMAESGARLVEVGTTNRTRLADYEQALTERTAVVLKVHASNYRMVGFVEQAAVSDLATLGPPVVVDAGSGLLDTSTPWLARRPAWLRDEPGVRQCLAAGAGLVAFSGDKLLGGPQAGVIVGRGDLVERLTRHPLARALRADKLALAGLQQVALAYLDDDVSSIPFWQMATTSIDVLRARAENLARRVERAKVVETEAAAGGGALPGLAIPSVGVAVEVAHAAAALATLRARRVVARVDDGLVVCDLRGVEAADDAYLGDALSDLAAPSQGTRPLAP